MSGSLHFCCAIGQASVSQDFVCSDSANSSTHDSRSGIVVRKHGRSLVYMAISLSHPPHRITAHVVWQSSATVSMQTTFHHTLLPLHWIPESYSCFVYRSLSNGISLQCLTGLQRLSFFLREPAVFPTPYLTDKRTAFWLLSFCNNQFSFNFCYRDYRYVPRSPFQSE